MEYALLKTKLHASGFQDTLDFSYEESDSLKHSQDRRAPKMGYTIEASGKSFSGTILPS